MNKYLIYKSKYNGNHYKILKLFLMSNFAYYGYRYEKEFKKFEEKPNVSAGKGNIEKSYIFEAEDDSSALLIFETMAEDFPFKEETTLE